MKTTVKHLLTDKKLISEEKHIIVVNVNEEITCVNDNSNGYDCAPCYVSDIIIDSKPYDPDGNICRVGYVKWCFINTIKSQQYYHQFLESLNSSMGSGEIDALSPLFDELNMKYTKAYNKITGGSLENFIYIIEIEINGFYRGLGIGERVINALCHHYYGVADFCFLKSFPKQLQATLEDETNLPEKEIKKAQKSLDRFYERIGFTRIKVRGDTYSYFYKKLDRAYL